MTLKSILEILPEKKNILDGNKLDLITITKPGQDPYKVIDKYSVYDYTPPGTDIDFRKIFGCGEQIALPTLAGEKVVHAAKKDIDWVEIAARGGPFTFPYAFIDLKGKFYAEDEMEDDLGNVIDSYNESMGLFEKEWKRAISEAESDDVFTHWEARYDS